MQRCRHTQVMECAGARNFATINGTVLAFRVSGPADGMPLMLVNSLGTDCRIWDRAVAAMGKHYRVLSYDKRGHGLSGSPPGPYRLEDHLDDLLGLADHNGLDRFALAGVSVGGLIALGAAARHPERVSALVVCSSAGRIGTEASWKERIERIEAGGMAAIADAVAARWFGPDFRRDNPAELAGWRNMLVRMDAEGYAATCATLRMTDLRAEISGIAAPVLTIAGADDESTPPALVRETAAMIPGARFEIIGNAGHLPPIEKPGILAGLMSKFLSEVDFG